MEVENVINLLDSYWYDLDFFNRSKPVHKMHISANSASSVGENMRNCTHDLSSNLVSSKIDGSDQLIPTLPTIHTNSQNTLEKMSSNSKLSDFSSASPNSVLQSPKLQTIFSGKESKEFDDSNSTSNTANVNSCGDAMKGKIGNSKTRKKKRLSKSLSDLEYEELKGFIDLGFVFSEQDKDSTFLASIIPGLQRLGNNNNENDNNVGNNDIVSNNVIDTNDDKHGNKCEVSRPYLSEAWEVLEKNKKENGVLKWKVPASSNQIDMKDYLKCWAHSVASAVK